jgi:hypothetical protein
MYFNNLMYDFIDYRNYFKLSKPKNFDKYQYIKSNK